MNALIQFTDNPLFWKVKDFALLPDRDMSIDWSSFLLAKDMEREAALKLVTSCQEMFVAKYCREEREGDEDYSGEASPTTLLENFKRHKRLARWMVKSNIFTYSSLKASDLIKFCGEISARDKKTISEKTLYIWFRVFNELWDFRSQYKNALRIEPDLVSDEIEANVRTRRNRPWKGVDELNAVALIREAFEWIETQGPVVAALSKLAWANTETNGKLPKKKRSEASKKFYDALALRADFIALQDRIEYVGPAYKLLSVATSMTEGACIFLILILVGMRNSEALSLDSDCITSGTHEDGEQVGYVNGIAAKAKANSRTWPADEAILRVIRFMVDLTGDARSTGSTSTKALLLQRPSGSPVFLPDRSTKRWSRTTLQRRLDLYVTSGMRRRGTRLEKFHPHMGRKSFAKFAVRRDKRNLEPVAAHFGHVYKAFTDGSYVGIDGDLAELLAEEDRAELAVNLERLLTGGRITGASSIGLEKLRVQAERFTGRKSLKALIGKLIKQGVQIAPCDWGMCVYSRSFSACKGDERGPNEINRAPDVCAGCRNFGVTEEHISWWEERRDREQNFLQQAGLPIQTVTVVRARLETSNKILTKLNAGNK